MSTDWHDAAQYFEQWKRYKLWDDTLYGLCSKHPQHSDVTHVAAKVYLIARSYQAGIERHAKDPTPRGRKGLDVVIDTLHDNHKQVDQVLSPLRKKSKVPTPGALPGICEAHFLLTSILKPVTPRGVVRSFVSKYMHFHAPIVPIYDSIASQVIKSRAWRPWISRPIPPAPSNQIDPEYWRFCNRLLQMVRSWREEEVEWPPTSRNLDIYLLGWGNWHRKSAT
jgi:hypothetical protein